jgi:putative membrane protein
VEHPIVGFVVRLIVQVVGNAAGLIVAAATLDDVSLTTAALVLDVLIFTGVYLVVLPMLQKQALRRSEAIAGSSALLTTLVALVVTVWLSDGLRISGVSAWIATTVIVWVVSLVIGIALPWLIVRRQRRGGQPAATGRRGR